MMFVERILDAEGNVVEVRNRIEASPPPPPVPAEIANWQARTILDRAGLFDLVDNAVKASGNREIVIAWEKAPNVVRRSAFVSAMAGALGLTDATIDDLFIEGAKIK
jgi:hypothetical protein